VKVRNFNVIGLSGKFDEVGISIHGNYGKKKDR